MMKGHTCGLQWRLSASFRSPDQAFSTNPGERLKSNHIETSDGTSRINSAPRLLRVQHYRLHLSRSECVRFLLAESQPASCSGKDRKSTRLNSSHQIISYAVFCLKKKNENQQ